MIELTPAQSQTIHGGISFEDVLIIYSGTAALIGIAMFGASLYFYFST